MSTLHRLASTLASRPPVSVQTATTVCEARTWPGLKPHRARVIALGLIRVFAPVSSSLSISKSSRAAILSPRTRRVKLTTRREQR
jgi:hypothetical protein